MSDKPNKPERTAILVNEQGRPTLHKFERREAAEVEVVHELADGTIRRTVETGIAEIFVCTETDVERRWGLL